MSRCSFFPGLVQRLIHHIHIHGTTGLHTLQWPSFELKLMLFYPQKLSLSKQSFGCSIYVILFAPQLVVSSKNSALAQGEKYPLLNWFVVCVCTMRPFNRREWQIFRLQGCIKAKLANKQHIYLWRATKIELIIISKSIQLSRLPKKNFMSFILK